MVFENFRKGSGRWYVNSVENVEKGERVELECKSPSGNMAALLNNIEQIHSLTRSNLLKMTTSDGVDSIVTCKHGQAPATSHPKTT